jgi:hypothetical protein
LEFELHIRAREAENDLQKFTLDNKMGGLGYLGEAEVGVGVV